MNPPDRRRRFPGAEAAHGAAALLRLLIEQQDSMTRLCEALAGGPVELRLVQQRATTEVPAQAHRLLPGRRFIERVTSLVAAGEVLTDNLVYVALDGLEPGLREDLETGRKPIGHLMDVRRHRRDTVAVGPDVLARLWAAVGEPDPAAMRCYTLCTPEGSAMLVCEALRGGLHALADRAAQVERAARLRQG